LSRPKPTGLRVRRAGMGDLDALVHQRREMWKDLGVKSRGLHDEADRVYRRWARYRIRNKTLVAWIVTGSDDRVAGGGCLWLQPIQPRPGRSSQIQPYLLSMYTEPDFRRKGVASMIVLAALQWCRKNRFAQLSLHASAAGRKLYRKLGFYRTWEMRAKTFSSKK